MASEGSLKQDNSSLQRVFDGVKEHRGVIYEELKPMQEEAIKGCLEGDVLAVLPTGYGKMFMCFVGPHV